jgi:putative nucleotidyltransferase with HDIG domain
MDHLLENVHSLPALPQTAARILGLLDDPNVHLGEITDLIVTDQGLTGNFLKLVNSAFYGFPRTVSTVNEAVLLLGLSTVRSVILAAATRGLLSRPVKGYDMARGELWQHSLACALCARLVAAESAYRPSEEAFIAGLLHDVGKVVLGQHVSQEVAQIRGCVAAMGVPFIVAEREVLGFDHAQVGARMTEKWHLPPKLVHAIAYHEVPPPPTNYGKLACVVHLANSTIREMGWGKPPEEQPFPREEEILPRLGLSPERLETIRGRTHDAVSASPEMFETGGTT